MSRYFFVAFFAFVVADFFADGLAAEFFAAFAGAAFFGGAALFAGAGFVTFVVTSGASVAGAGTDSASLRSFSRFFSRAASA